MAEWLQHSVITVVARFQFHHAIGDFLSLLEIYSALPYKMSRYILSGVLTRYATSFGGDVMPSVPGWLVHSAASSGYLVSHSTWWYLALRKTGREGRGRGGGGGGGGK